MEIGRVLIVSSHPLFADVLARLVQLGGGEVIARATNVEQALPLLHPTESEGPITIIVDYEEAEGRDAKWLALLQPRTAAHRIIFLSLQGNEMIVHEQRRVSHVSETELLRVLRGDSFDEN